MQMNRYHSAVRSSLLHLCGSSFISVKRNMELNPESSFNIQAKKVGYLLAVEKV